MQLLAIIMALVAAAASASHLRSDKKALLHTNLARCGTKDHTPAQAHEMAQKIAALPAEDENFKGTYANVQVYFHIIKMTDGTGDVTDMQVNEQIQLLRDSFRGVKFNLQSVHRVENDAWFNQFNGETDDYAMKAALRQGGANALNIYTLDGSQSGALGYAYLPINYAYCPICDGVVLDFRTLPGGSYNDYNLGMTLVHETGHWMGLDHTFAGGCAYLGKMGDRIRDTPAVAAPNFGCQPANTDSCPGTKKGFKGYDLVRNFMDYGDDRCIDSFTPGQVKFMKDTWRAIRKP